MKTLSDVFLRAWYQGACWFRPLLVVLWPLSCLFCTLAARRRQRLQQDQLALPVPVVVVGNISVGGTGKTPLLCALAQALQQRGKRVGIVSRGYGGSHSGAPRLVQVEDDASTVGDEPLLLARATACPVVIGHDRLAAAQLLIATQQPDVILSDDGLQHYALPRTVEVAVLDGERGVGNGFCLPAGPLREPVARLQEVDFVVVNGVTTEQFSEQQLLVALQSQTWRRVCNGERLSLETLAKDSTVHAVAGIGNPQRFFRKLRDMGLVVMEHPFADHHRFTASDLQFTDGLPVVMTEKDAVKCAAFAAENCYALQVQMLLPAQWVDDVLACIARKFRSMK